MALPELSRLAIPAVLALISFLGYSSQYLFPYFEPGPLEYGQKIKFNVLLVLLLISYFRACYTDPGTIPKEWASREQSQSENTAFLKEQNSGRKRWCRKCQMVKPPRAHHCKVCKRCIPKMDHHCPWTSNCVSHRTLPHFIRFLFYAVAAMVYLQYLLYLRAKVIWENKHLPSYLGPSASQLVHLFILIVTNTLTLFALAILLIRTIWCLAANTTTIEGWEIERHETLVRRARVLGGYLRGPDGQMMRIVRQEFPYDIGIFANIAQGMGSKNPLAWLFPLSPTPGLPSGLEFEENGFEDPGTTWPPPDPDRIPYIRPSGTGSPSATTTATPFVQNDPDDTAARIAAFRQRQQADLQRRRPFHRRFNSRGEEIENYVDDDEDGEQSERGEDEASLGRKSSRLPSETGEEGWRNAEGERLRDFGVDEDVEFYDEDEVPLAELVRLKKAREERLKQV